MRKLASVVAIATAEPIPDTDGLDVVTMEGKGWRVVTSRGEFSPGDRAVYFEIDSALPADDDRYAFLHARCLKAWRDKHGKVLAQAVRIRTIRLRRAAELLREGRMTVTEVSYATGFSSVSYFSRCFRAMFGAAPTNFSKMA